MTHYPIAGNKKRQKGFVLLATLLVISLLTMLLVASVVLEKIELESSYNSSRIDVARQNALFGLSQALNQLQIAAGPDRRVTARADILNSVNAGPAEGYSGATPDTDAGQSFWTGVWKTTSNDFSGCAGNGKTTTNPDPAIGQNPGPAGSFLYFDYTADGNPNATLATAPLTASTPPSRAQLYYNANVNWLISWPYSSTIKNSPDPTASLSTQIPSIQIPTLSGNITLSGTSCIVNLANNLNIATTANPNLAGSNNHSVSAPKVPIVEVSPSGKQLGVGTYAYWVSDEGVKAKSDIPDPYLASTPGSAGAPNGLSKSQAHFTIAQSNGCSDALNLNGVPNAADLRTLSFIAPTLSSMSYADSAQTWLDFANEPNTYSPDFTVSSYGLLADNFNGGLRQDLTAALENNLTFQYHFNDGTGNEDARKLYGMDAIYQNNIVPDIEDNPWTSTTQGMVIDGMRWSSLYYYYNIYHASMFSPITTDAAVNPNSGVGSQFASECAGTSPTITGRIYIEPNPGPGGGKVQIDGMYPALIYWNYTYGLDLNCTGGNDASGYNYDFIASSSPFTVSYNPYDVSIKTPKNSYASLSGTIASTTGRSNAPTIEIDNNGTAIWGPFYISLPDPNYETEVETQPYTAGECRAYYLNPNWNTNQPMLTPASLSVFNPSSITGLPNGVTQFTTASTSPPGMSFGSAGNRLIPIGTPNTYFSSTRDQQQELLSPNPPIHLAVPASNLGNYTLVAGGGQRISLIGAELTRYNYIEWPQSTGVYSSGTPDLFAGPNFFGTGEDTLVQAQPNSSIDPTAHRDLNFASSTLGYMASVEYHAPGTASTGFSFQGTNSLGPNLIFIPQNISPTVPIGLPGLAAGGAAFSPLSIDYNNYAADWSNTGRFAARYDPSSDLGNSEFSNTVNGTGMSESGWLPNSAGKDTSHRQVILHDVPRGPLLSLGQFKNMSCRYYAIATTPPSQTTIATTGYCWELGFSNYPIGGSYPSGLNTNCAIQLQTLLMWPGNSSDSGYGMPENSVMQDDNFMANSVLFDGYFLSTVPPLNVPDGANWPVDTTQFETQALGQAYIDANRPLPNSRLVYYRRSQSSPMGNPPSSDTQSPNIADLQCTNSKTANLRKPAANLLINGAFNVNSTSSTAWTALLTSTGISNPPSGSSINNTMALLNPQSNGTSTAVTNYTFSQNEVPFLNFNLALGSTAWTGSANNNVGFFGMVDLSTASVQSLASRIVTQVQMRGPFLSLGDFLNHRLRRTPPSAGGPNSGNPNQDAYSVSGALQYAIDGWPSMTWPPSNYSPANAINAALGANASMGMASSTAHDSVNSIYYTYYFKSSIPPVPANYSKGILPDAPCQTGVGAPGTLLQNDLLQAIAPVIADRSDTFTVRVYGQALSPSGKSDAEVYAEAVVQRLPEYIYSAENGTYEGTTGGGSGAANYAYDSPSQTTLNETISGVNVNGLTKCNSVFGRRFKIISFRWFNQNEI